MARPPLGRPRGFDAHAALRAALDVFWQRGLVATSLDDLNQAMGLSRSSFYACFGSKHSLLMAALRCYADERFAALTAASQTANARAAVRAMLATIAEVDGGSHGCFFCNAVAELAPGDAELVAFAQAHTARVARLLAATLVRAGCAPAQATQRAGAALALAMGLTTLRKAGVPADVLKPLLAQAEVWWPGKARAARPRQRT